MRIFALLAGKARRGRRLEAAAAPVAASNARREKVCLDMAGTPFVVELDPRSTTEMPLVRQTSRRPAPPVRRGCALEGRAGGGAAFLGGAAWGSATQGTAGGAL